MIKKVLIGLIIASVTSVLLYFAGEYYLRNFVLVTRSTGHCDQLDPLVKFKGIPNTTCTSRTPEWDVVNTQNSFGLRSPETSLQKPSGVYRILFLGDSFTHGYGVHADASFPSLVEKKLNEKFKGNPKIEVINSGVPNYSPLIEYLYLKNEGIQFDPDLVILEFDLTDFSNDYVYGKEAVYDTNGIPVALPSTPSAQPVNTSPIAAPAGSPASPKLMEQSKLLPFVPSDIKRYFHDNSVLYKWVSTQLKIMLGQPLADPELETKESYYTIVKPDTSHDEVLWKAPKQNLTLINTFLSDRHIPFMVSAHPHAILVNGSEWGNGRLLHGLERGKVYSDRYFAELARFLENQKVPFINLLPYFRQSSRHPLYFPFDGHFTENGHKVAADGIISELPKLGVLPSR